MMSTGCLYGPDDFMRRPCLGRSLKHLIESVTQLHSQGIGFKSLTEQIDTTTSGGKLIFHIFGALAAPRKPPRSRTPPSEEGEGAGSFVSQSDVAAP
jgi:Resolvase, N terminal domain